MELCPLSTVYCELFFEAPNVLKRFPTHLPTERPPSALRLLGALSVVCVLGASGNAIADPQNKQALMAQQRMEHRQRQMEEMRAIRQAERQRVKEVVRASLVERRAQHGELANERPMEQFRRMSPEEKMALRKQIREARREIYLQKQN